MGRKINLTQEQIEAIDWDLPRQQIADSLGVTLGQLQRIRAKEQVPAKFPTITPRTDWSQVDYSRKTRDLMKEHDVSRTWICEMRKKYAKENQ